MCKVFCDIETLMEHKSIRSLSDENLLRLQKLVSHISFGKKSIILAGKVSKSEFGEYIKRSSKTVDRAFTEYLMTGVFEKRENNQHCDDSEFVMISNKLRKCFVKI